MQEIDDIIHALMATVNELKKGILDYNNRMAHAPPESQFQLEEKIKQMHEIALKLNTGIEGLQELKQFTQEQLGQ